MYLDGISNLSSNPSFIGYAVTELMKIAGERSAFIILLDKKMRHIRSVRLKRRGHMKPESVAVTVDRVINETGAASFVLAHNHPSGILTPSSADRITTDLLIRKYNGSNVKFIEHYIVSDDEYITMINIPTNRRYDQLKEGSTND